MMKSVKVLQQLLNQNGSHLVEDGDLGRKTRAEIDKLRAPSFVKSALKDVGVHEISGDMHESRILEYHALSGGFSTDEIPWCGSYNNFHFIKSGYRTVKYPARAKSWLKFGISSVMPVMGSVAVKSRKGGGHVCIVVGKYDNGDLLCVGGNQNNEVNIKRYRAEVFMDFRVHPDVCDYKLLSYDQELSTAGSEA